MSEEAGLVCPHCGKSYKRLNGLRAHLKSKHQPNDAEGPEPEVGQQEDDTLYYKVAHMSLLCRESSGTSRMQEGTSDGQRIIRLYSRTPGSRTSNGGPITGRPKYKRSQTFQ